MKKGILVIVVIIILLVAVVIVVRRNRNDSTNSPVPENKNSAINTTLTNTNTNTGVVNNSNTSNTNTTIVNNTNNQADVDSDDDGLSDTREADIGTDPKDSDTDDDGYSDGDEVKNGYDPLEPSLKKMDPGDYNYELTQNGVIRYYLLHIPDSYGGKATPLVLAFHGGMGTAEIMAEYYDLKQKSDKEGFIVAFPNGASRYESKNIATWNAGNCCGYAVESQSDDVGFVRLVIQDIKTKINISQIYATGMSNGGMLSHRLACDMSDVFSAVASVAGTNNYDDCQSKNPISVMHIHGLEDEHVLFNGGCGPTCNTGIDYTSVPDTISDWVQRNKCNQNPERVLDEENAYCDLYTGCTNGVQVKLCVAKDGGHSWPGVREVPNPLEANTPSQALDATDEIWEFFKAN